MNTSPNTPFYQCTSEGRPLLHRMAFSEMVVPYGDPRAPHSMKNAFDAGEDGFGRNANSLVLIHTSYSHILTTCPNNTSYSHIITTYPDNTPYQHTIPTHHINTP